jgi:hypothetical protein
MSEVHKVTIQIRAPRGKDAGKVAIGHYVIADGFVVLTDETGKPAGDNKGFLDPDGDARLIACRMLRRQQKAGSSSGDFSRPIKYPKIGF